MSPASNLNETIEVDPHNAVDNKHTEVGMVINKKKNAKRVKIQRVLRYGSTA